MCVYVSMYLCMDVYMNVFMCFIKEITIINVGEEIQSILFTKAKNEDTFSSMLMGEEKVSHPRG